MGEAVVRVRAVVHGRVQMVGFRAFVIHHAGDAGLSGTVRNEPGTGSGLRRTTVTRALKGAKNAMSAVAMPPPPTIVRG